MHEITLQAEKRTQLGKHTRTLRREGKIPGVFYVLGEQNIPILVSEKSLKPLIFTSETHLINLKLSESETKSCILRDIQFDPVTDKPVHFDLQGLREDRKITIEIPVIISGGTPAGVRDGGILQHFIHKLKVSCLPKDIPEHVEVNPENLKINQFIHVSDVKIPNVTLLENETSAIIGVMPPIKEEELTTTATAEEAVEPEVIAKGKKLEEGEEGAVPAEGEKKTAAGGEAAPKAAAPEAKKEEKKK